MYEDQLTQPNSKQKYFHALSIAQSRVNWLFHLHTQIRDSVVAQSSNCSYSSMSGDQLTQPNSKQRYFHALSIAQSRVNLSFYFHTQIRDSLYALLL